MIETSLGLLEILQHPLVIFGNLRQLSLEIFGECSEAFMWPLDDF